MNKYFDIISARLTQQFAPEAISTLIVDISIKVVIGILVLATYYLVWSLLLVLMKFTIQLKPIDLKLTKS